MCLKAHQTFMLYKVVFKDYFCKINNDRWVSFSKFAILLIDFHFLSFFYC